MPTSAWLLDSADKGWEADSLQLATDSLCTSPLRGSMCLDFDEHPQDFGKAGDDGVLQSTSDLVPILAELSSRQENSGQSVLPSLKASPQYVGRRRHAATHSAQISAADVRAVLHDQISLSSNSMSSRPCVMPIATEMSEGVPGSLEQLSSTTQLVDSLEKQLQQAQATIAAQQTQWTEAQEALKTLQKRVEAKDAEMKGAELRYAEKLRLANEDLEGATRRNEELLTELIQHKQQLQGAEAAALEGNQEKQHQQLLALQEVSAIRGKLLQQEGSVQTLEIDLKAAKLEIKYAESLASQLRDELALRDNEIGLLRERLAASTQEQQQLKEDLLSTRTNCALLNERNRSLECMLSASTAGEIHPRISSGSDYPRNDLSTGRALFDASNVSHLNYQGSTSKPNLPNNVSATPRMWQENSGDVNNGKMRSSAAPDQDRVVPRLAPLKAEGTAPPAGRTLREQDGGASRRQRSSASGDGSITARPYGTEDSLQDLITKTKRLEDRLMVVNREKELLEAEQSRLPSTSGRTLAERHRRAAMEERLDSLTKEAGTLRMSLKQLGVLKK